MKKLGFGCMRLPRVDMADRMSDIDVEETKKLFDVFMENGFNYFDTAFKYCGGMSETTVREALTKRYPRESYILTTKLSSEFMTSKEQQQEVYDQQFINLGVDYVDYYLLHNIGEVNYRTAMELDSFEFLKKAKREGRAKQIGMSYHDNAALLDKILTDHPEIEIVQLQINYLDWENEGIQSRKCYEVARKHGKPVIVMEPLKGGALANVPAEVEQLFKAYSPKMSPASWAIRFAASHEGIMTVLSGMNTMEQVLDNVGYMKDFVPFTEEEFAVTDKAAAIINASSAIPCTACRYCTETCPTDIPIPEYLSLLQDGYSSTQFAYYYNYSQGHGKASDCIDCKQCESHCPQHIEITKHLQEAKRFDSFQGYR